jgi:uncharacterized protein GlcG (DUF336 family)
LYFRFELKKRRTSSFLRRSYKLFIVANAALMLVTGPTFGSAQGLLTQKALSEQAALTIIQGALDKCRANGYHISVVVLDASGLVKVRIRGDGTGPHTFEHARRKAYTALTFKRTSAETAKACAASPTPVIEGTVGAAGGAPINAGNEVLGVIGVSGAPGGDKDEPCAYAGTGVCFGLDILSM